LGRFSADETLDIGMDTGSPISEDYNSPIRSTPSHDELIFTFPPAAMTKLQRLHAVAGRLAEIASEIVANPAAAYGLELALIEAMVGFFGNHEAREDSVAQRQHELIMRRFWRVVEENPRFGARWAARSRAMALLSPRPDRSTPRCSVEAAATPVATRFVWRPKCRLRNTNPDKRFPA
jgi:hypothetical protein